VQVTTAACRSVVGESNVLGPSQGDAPEGRSIVYACTAG